MFLTGLVNDQLMKMYLALDNKFISIFSFSLFAVSCLN